MKYRLMNLMLCVLLTGISVLSMAQVKITDGSIVTVDPNSILELESTNKGLLIPRITLTSLILPDPLTAPVPVGMIVFNTGGTVAEGFYYWDETNWQRVISTGTNILKTVTRSVNSTLTKTDNIVLASNDITLTLPAVTSADDGLVITVKNSGTYMDVVTVTGATGLEFIDGSISSILYKNWGRTYIASNGHWIIKENVGRRDNVFEVSAKSSWTSIAEVIEFLGTHMTGPSIVLIGGGTYQVAASQTINLPYPVTFEGFSAGSSIIMAGAGVWGNPMFICETSCNFKKLTLMTFAGGGGNDAIRLPTVGTYHEILNCTFVGFNKAIASSSASTLPNNTTIIVSSGAFINCAGAAIEIAEGAASDGVLSVDNSIFLSCANGIHLVSGVSQSISIRSNTFTNTISGTDISVLYVPATFISFKNIYITNNAWNNQGTFISGFDFSRSDGRDADAYIESNAGIEDKNPHCNISVVNNSSTTTCATAGSWYKANWTNTSTYTNKFTVTNNKITYQPSNSRDVIIHISGNVSVNSTNRVITVAIVKNGVTATRFGETSLRVTTANQPFQFSTVIYVGDAIKNDYFELFCSSLNNGDDVLFQDINIYVDSK
jgi:hypothetical protein